MIFVIQIESYLRNEYFSLNLGGVIFGERIENREWRMDKKYRTLAFCVLLASVFVLIAGSEG
jgi:hypothetical protein